MNRNAARLGALALCSALLVIPWFGSAFYTELAAKTLVLSIFAMSLDLLVGFSGLVSFGHAAYFGVAAYAVALLTPKFEAASLWIALPVSIAAAGFAALVIGFLVLHTRGVYFIMVTLAFAQMLFYLFNDSPALGGSDGLYVKARPIEGRSAAYFAIWSAAVLVYLLLSRVLRAPYGRVLAGIRGNEQRMRSLGYPTRSYKLAAFVIAGAMAGLAGYLDATLYGFVNPAQLGWRQSGLILVTVLLGGKGTLYGPALGGLLLAFIEHYGARVTEHWNAIIAALVIAVVLLLPRGIAGLVQGAPRA
jgi:branched-chain amino acid transport system permease protein